MSNDISTIVIITFFFVIIFEYIKFFNDTHSPFFCICKLTALPLCVYLFIQIIIAIVAVFLVYRYTSFANYEYPINIFSIAFVGSIFSAGIINNLEFYVSDKEMNKLRKYINDCRRNIISDFKKRESVDIRKIGYQLEKSLSLNELKNEYRLLNPKKFSGVEEQLKREGLDDGDQKSRYALEIAIENIEMAKSLLQRKRIA